MGCSVLFPLTTKNEAQTLMPLVAITMRSFSLKEKKSIAGKQIKRQEKNPELIIFELKNKLILKPGLLLEY